MKENMNSMDEIIKNKQDVIVAAIVEAVVDVNNRRITVTVLVETIQIVVAKPVAENTKIVIVVDNPAKVVQIIVDENTIIGEIDIVVVVVNEIV